MQVCKLVYCLLNLTLLKPSIYYFKSSDQFKRLFQTFVIRFAISVARARVQVAKKFAFACDHDVEYTQNRSSFRSRILKPMTYSRTLSTDLTVSRTVCEGNPNVP